MSAGKNNQTTKFGCVLRCCHAPPSEHETVFFDRISDCLTAGFRLTISPSATALDRH
ncbi:MAG: hypothetical protein JO326_03040 [Acetobacteraceae bacterium]|nr:hypothetical protein [Acetobacteraceae bacterium]